MTRIQIRRRLTAWAKQLRLRRLALALDPGPRVRLWDADFALIADSDRGDRIANDAWETNGGCLQWNPATTVRVGGAK